MTGVVQKFPRKITIAKYSIFALCMAAVMGFAVLKDLPAMGVIVCGALALALARKDRVLPLTQTASTAAIPACSAPSARTSLDGTARLNEAARHPESASPMLPLGNPTTQ
jgi:hypothetical protein